MMDDLRTTARLVDIGGAGTIGTVLTRAEIEAAAGADSPATLVLDLDRVEAAEGGEATAHATVAVDWDRETLEQLLASTEDQEIELWFDESELARAFEESDVEGHGLRQRAAVIAVAVAAAGVSSSPAFARMAADTSGAGSVAPTAGISVSSQADQGLALQHGGAVRALQQEEKLTQGLDTRTAQTAAMSSSGGQGLALQRGGAVRALQQEEKLTQGLDSRTTQPAVTSTSGGSALSTGELAAALAGGALLISAAGFGVSRKRTPPAQPA